jgi:hypothetical protein
MPDQLSLFPLGLVDQTDQTADTSADDRPADLPPVDEVFETSRSSSHPSDYLALLLFISRFPHYSPLNTFLLYTQNPSASLVATAGTWMKVYNRRPIRGARPLIILAPMSPVVFVYDLADTEGDPVQVGYLKTAEAKSAWDNKVYQHTVTNSFHHGIEIRETPRQDTPNVSVMPVTGRLREKYHDLNISSAASYLIFVNSSATIKDRYVSLVKNLGRIFCGHLGIDSRAWWPDRREFSTASEIIEAESVTLLVSARKGLREVTEREVSACGDISGKLPPFSLNIILQVVGYIEDMGRSLWKGPKKKSRYK